MCADPEYGGLGMEEFQSVRQCSQNQRECARAMRTEIRIIMGSVLGILATCILASIGWGFSLSKQATRNATRIETIEYVGQQTNSTLKDIDNKLHGIDVKMVRIEADVTAIAKEVKHP